MNRYLVTTTLDQRTIEAEDMLAAIIACNAPVLEVQRIDGKPSWHWTDTPSGAYSGWEACGCERCKPTVYD